MSYDFVVYLPEHRTIQRSTLATELAGLGWVARFIEPHTGLRRADGLIEYDIVLACPRGSIDEAELDHAIEGGADSIDRFAERAPIGSCAVGVEDDFSVDPEMLNEPLDGRVMEALRAARSRYEISTSAARTKQSFPLQDAVARAIAALLGGLLEDPQSSDYWSYAVGAVRTKRGYRTKWHWCAQSTLAKMPIVLRAACGLAWMRVCDWFRRGQT
jgi:hypothetical protein